VIFGSVLIWCDVEHSAPAVRKKHLHKLAHGGEACKDKRIAEFMEKGAVDAQAEKRNA
jgi:hypothetical protein